MTKHERIGNQSELPLTGYHPRFGFELRKVATSLSELAGHYGLSYFLLVELPRGDRTTFSENLIASNWPNEFTDYYRENDRFFCSNIMTAFRRTILPISMGPEAFGCAAANVDDTELEGLFVNQGANNTFGFTLHDVDANVYAFAFSGARDPLELKEQSDIVRRATEVLNDVARDDLMKDGPLERLSHRELECLRWTAAGKSSDEIGIILDLSSHTIVGYLKTAMRKLDTVNRMQAVARAYRYRLL